jgi:hypothetical protein
LLTKEKIGALIYLIMKVFIHQLWNEFSLRTSINKARQNNYACNVDLEMILI